jgi:D-glycero-D-manno-heptose 1,7-bisphosphate phosphatase
MPQSMPMTRTESQALRGPSPRLHLTPEGNWCEVRRKPADCRPRPALFLDRDGVIVEDVGYIGRPEDVALIEGAGEAIARANRLGFAVVVVSNQSGIGRHYFGWPDFARVQSRIADALSQAGAELDMVLACGFHPDAVDPAYRHPSHPWRKPAPGMILAAAEHLTIDLGRSWIVGDHASDIRAGRSAGLKAGIHVMSGHGPADRMRPSRFSLPSVWPRRST